MLTSDKIYLSLCSLFAVIIVMGNLTYQKFVSLSLFSFYTLELSVGALLYPFTFILTDLIAEFYGKEKANFCIRLTIALSIFVAFAIMGMDYLDATQWSPLNTETFHRVFGFYNFAFIGSLIACFIGQRLDVVLFLWIRQLTGERWLWFRYISSTAIALLADTSLVISFLTLFGILPQERMGALIFNTYLFKFFFTICGTPLFYLGYWVIQRWLSDSGHIPLHVYAKTKDVEKSAA